MALATFSRSKFGFLGASARNTCEARVRLEGIKARGWGFCRSKFWFAGFLRSKFGFLGASARSTCEARVRPGGVVRACGDFVVLSFCLQASCVPSSGFMEQARLQSLFLVLRLAWS